LHTHPLAQLAVDVHCTDLKASFDLYVARCSIKYLHAWLLDAAAKRVFLH